MKETVEDTKTDDASRKSRDELWNCMGINHFINLSSSITRIWWHPSCSSNHITVTMSIIQLDTSTKTPWFSRPAISSLPFDLHYFIIKYIVTNLSGVYFRYTAEIMWWAKSFVKFNWIVVIISHSSLCNKRTITWTRQI